MPCNSQQHNLFLLKILTRGGDPTSIAYLGLLLSGKLIVCYLMDGKRNNGRAQSRNGGLTSLLDIFMCGAVVHRMKEESLLDYVADGVGNKLITAFVLLILKL